MSQDGASRGRRVFSFSPAGFVLCAGLVAILFAAAHLAGFRQYTTILSGSVPEGAASEFAMAAALVYLVLYFAFVLAVPILIIAACLFRVFAYARSQM